MLDKQVQPKQFVKQHSRKELQIWLKAEKVKHMCSSPAGSITINHQVLIPSLVQTRVYHDVCGCFDNFFADCSSSGVREAGAEVINQALICFLSLTGAVEAIPSVITHMGLERQPIVEC